MALDDPDALVLRLGLALRSERFCVVTDLLGSGLREFAVLLGRAPCLLAQVLGLFLGEAEDLLDPRAETGVRRLRVADLGLGVLRFEVELLDALFESGDTGQSAVTVGDELRDAFVHLSAVVPTPHKLEAVGEVSLMGFLSNETGEVIGGILGAEAVCHRADACLIWRMTPLLSG